MSNRTKTTLAALGVMSGLVAVDSTISAVTEPTPEIDDVAPAAIAAAATGIFAATLQHLNEDEDEED